MRWQIGDKAEEREVLSMDEVKKEIAAWRDDLLCYKHIHHAPDRYWVIYELGNPIIPDVPVYSEVEQWL